MYGLTDFIAYCGGVLGLCLGFSLLSIVEIGYYLTLRVCFVTRQKGTIGNMPQNTSAEISNAPIAVIETPDKRNDSNKFTSCYNLHFLFFVCRSRENCLIGSNQNRIVYRFIASPT